MTDQPLKTIQQIEAESMAQVVGQVNGRPVTRGALNEAFKRVQPAGNWKLAIDATVSLTTDERDMVAEAITFFTGSVARFEARSEVGILTTYHVTAAGYYATIGA